MLALAASALLFLAGCTMQNPPATTTAPGGGAGTGTDLPGTTDPPANGGNGGGAGFAPQTGHDEATDATAPGLKVVGDLRTCDAGYCVDAVATNEGPRTYRVSSICIPPWMESMQKDGKDVQKEEPRAYCMAFGTSPMEPGSRIEANFTWDQNVWNAETEKLEPAAQGGYDWTITFTAYEDPDSDGVHRLDLTFHVLVGIPT